MGDTRVGSMGGTDGVNSFPENVLTAFMTHTSLVEVFLFVDLGNGGYTFHFQG